MIAGLAAFIVFIVVGFTLLPDSANFEVTAFEILIPGFGFVGMMIVANFCYSAGAISERVFRPSNPERYRKNCYRFVFWVSVIFPFSIPALVLLLAVLSQNHAQP
ncbi:MAG: hypothetical protein V4733_06080 [Verrucomicrobiota bacterium]